MKANVLAAVLAVFGIGAAGCVTEDTPLLLGNVLPYTEDCGPENADDVFISRGALNVEYGSQYEKYVFLESQVPSAAASGTTSEAANDITVKEVQLDYASDGTLTLAPERYPVHFVVTAGGGQAFPRTAFFPTKASEMLQTSLVAGDVITVRVGLRFTGNYRSGGAVQSNRIEFPITLTKRPVQCSGSVVFAGCGPAGADSNPPFCSVATTDGGL